MRETRIGETILQLIRYDITRVKVDAIVNAANEALLPGGGVSGAIHRAGGPSIWEECRPLGPIQTGSAVITGGGQLSVTYVIHAVGPVWEGGQHGEDDLLAAAYRASLELADDHDIESIAFPSISTGIYGFPIDRAARIALRTVAEHLQGDTGIGVVTFVLFSDDDIRAYESALGELLDG